MSYGDRLTTADIKVIFAEEITTAGGTVSDTYDDGACLFTRSILPWVREVRARDQVQGGVALRATEAEVWVHPYVFRQVCRNGAIIAQAIQTRHLEGLEYSSPVEAGAAVREAMRACCVEKAFTDAAETMRSAQEVRADIALNMLPMISQLSIGRGSRIFRDILERFLAEGDQSRFGLMNAVTSLARDTHDAELRWRLEELGGGIPALRVPTLLPDDAAALLDDEFLSPAERRLARSSKVTVS